MGTSSSGHSRWRPEGKRHTSPRCGELQARGQKGIREGPPALRAVSHPMMLLSAPVLSDALTAEVMLAAETDRVLINAQTSGTQELVLSDSKPFESTEGSVMHCAGSRTHEPGVSESAGLSLRLENVPGLIPEKERK